VAAIVDNAASSPDLTKAIEELERADSGLINVIEAAAPASELTEPAAELAASVADMAEPAAEVAEQGEATEAEADGKTKKKKKKRSKVIRPGNKEF
jgi:hypothetical protein